MQLPPQYDYGIATTNLSGASRGRDPTESDLHRLYQFRDYLRSLCSKCLTPQRNNQSWRRAMREARRELERFRAICRVGAAHGRLFFQGMTDRAPRWESEALMAGWSIL